MILVDTNILVRLSNANDVDYKTTHAVIAGCKAKGRQLVVSQQTLHEFWAVATRSAQKNGMGMTPARADRYFTRFLRVFSLIADPPDVLSAWRTLVNVHAVTGLHCYDARLAAIAQLLNMRGLMTYNLADFKHFPVTLINPKDSATW